MNRVAVAAEAGAERHRDPDLPRSSCSARSVP